MAKVKIREVRHYSARNVYVRADGNQWMKQNATHHARVAKDQTNHQWVQIGGAERIKDLDEEVELLD